MKLNIRNKLFLAFAAVLVLAALVGVVGINGMSQIATQDTALYQNQLVALDALQEIRVNVYMIGRDMRHALLFIDEPEVVSTKLKEIEANQADIETSLKALEPLVLTEEGRVLLEKAKNSWAAYQLTLKPVLDAVVEGNASQAKAGLNAMLESGSQLDVAMGDYASRKRDQAKAAVAENTATFESARWLQVGLTGSAIVVGLALAFFMARSIANAARQMAVVADGIARGELGQTITIKSKDELGDMAAAFTRMIAYLQEMAHASKRLAEGDLSVTVTPKSAQDELGTAMETALGNLREVIGDLVNVSERLAEGDLTVLPRGDYRGNFARIKESLETALSNLNGTLWQTNNVANQVIQSVAQVRSVGQDLAANAEEQSSAAEEVTSNLEETEAQVKANAESSNVANQLVGESAKNANAGQEKMKAMTGAMTAIARSSQEINKIIKVIDEIAFQTNLLALNAAVEAARAGQHGRGFAVVAQEVRNLAGRSAKAAKETAELIEDSVRRVQEGVTMADEMAASLGDIVQRVTKVRDLVGEINVASEEQARGVQQINSAMIQVSQGAQANSQQSEELASTADELGSLGDRLREEMARFRLSQQLANRMMVEGLGGGVTETAAGLSKQKRAGATPAPAAVPVQAGKHGKNGGSNGKPGLHLDRDERGYGQF